MMATAPPKQPRGSGLRVSDEIAVGALLDGKYRIQSVIARGGMGLVVAALHEKLGHRVAIKLLRSGVLDDTAGKRVLREARALASLKSEHVTRVLDVGELDSGAPFIVMEFLEGEDLSRVLARQRRLPLDQVASYLIQAADAIAEAHALGLVHRDLKPSNLFLTTRRDRSPLVKLLDFGISKPVIRTNDESLTTAESALGTPHYMSPEQFLSARDVDTRADIWAFGVLLYHLLSGERPFSAETVPALHIAIASEPAPRLRDLLPDIPPQVDELVDRCLRKDPPERPASVAEIVEVLIRFTDETSQRRYEHLCAPATSQAVTDRTERLSAPRHSNRIWLFAVIALVAGASVAAWVHFFRPPKLAGQQIEPVASASPEITPPLPDSVAPMPIESIGVTPPPPSRAKPRPRASERAAEPTAPKNPDPYEQRR